MFNADQIGITGWALASGLGCDRASVHESLQTDRRALSFEHRFREWLHCPLGEIPWHQLGFERADPFGTDLLMQEGCRILFDQMQQETQLFHRFSAERIGLFVGTTTSGIRGFFRALDQQKSAPTSAPLRADMQQAYLMNDLIDRFPFHGPAWTLSSSCAASAHALVLASDALQNHMIDAAVVIGVDILNLVTIFGFDALQVLDHELCQPFKAERNGINLAEVIAMVQLERTPVGQSGTVIRGHHCLSEAHHMTQPAPHGIWMQKTMEEVLRKSGLRAADISYINPHGTATEANDRTEGEALAQVFGSERRFHPTKKLTGHTLGASGVFELILSHLVLEAGEANSPTHLALQPSKPRLALSNSFGFGGANVSIIIEHHL